MPGRRIGTWTATAFVVTEVIGVGILLTPATMMRTLGGPWAPIAMWLAMGALTASGALCYAELATRFPRAGGTYVFLREGFGRRAAFVYGWMAMLVMDPGITAALGIGLAQYLLATIGASPSYTPTVAVVCIAAFAIFATRGIAASSHVLRWTATAKLVVVGVLLLAGATRLANGAVLTGTTRELAFDPQAIAGAIVAAFFAFGGWWDLGRMSEEVESPRRTMPTALIGGVALVTVVYVMVTLTFILVAPTSSVPSDAAFVEIIGASLFGPAAGRVLAVLVVVTVSGSLAAVLLGAPRTYLAMARDGVLPLQFKWFDEARGSSPVGTFVQATLACALVMLGSFDQILGYFVPAAVFFLGLSAAALFQIGRPSPSASVFRVPLFPLPLIVFLTLIAVMVVLFSVGQPTQTSLGATVVLLGLLISRFVI